MQFSWILHDGWIDLKTVGGRSKPKGQEVHKYAKAGTSASDVGSAAQQGTSIASTPTQAPAPTQITSDQTQTGTDDEKVTAEKENESESEGASGQDPIESPGTPGYEEGNFDGQHEF